MLRADRKRDEGTGSVCRISERTGRWGERGWGGSEVVSEGLKLVSDGFCSVVDEWEESEWRQWVEFDDCLCV